MGKLLRQTGSGLQMWGVRLRAGSDEVTGWRVGRGGGVILQSVGGSTSDDKKAAWGLPSLLHHKTGSGHVSSQGRIKIKTVKGTCCSPRDQTQEN